MQIKDCSLVLIVNTIENCVVNKDLMNSKILKKLNANCLLTFFYFCCWY